MLIFHDDIIFKLQSKGGISNYWKNLKKHLKHHQNFEYFTNFSKKKSLLPLKILRYIDYSLKFENKVLFHSSYYRISCSEKAINIITVYDFIYEKFAKGIRKKIHVWQKKRAIYNAHHIICISHSTKKDLLEYYPDVNPSKISVVYLGVSEKFKKLQKRTNDKMLLFVGARNGYKNFDALIDAANQLNGYSLKIVGGGRLSNYELKRLQNLAYQHILNCNDETLNKLYNNCFALIYPSLYEGFGLPIIESLKSGCPVICNNGSSTGEVGGKYVISGEMSAKFIVDSVYSLEKSDFRSKLIENGIKYASQFNWQTTANETHAIYKKLWKDFH